MLVRSPLLTLALNGANLYSPDVWFADAMASLSGVTFVLLRVRLYALVEAAALRSIGLRYAGAPIATRVFFLLFSFCFFRDVAFSDVLAKLRWHKSKR